MNTHTYDFRLSSSSPNNSFELLLGQASGQAPPGFPDLMSLGLVATEVPQFLTLCVYIFLHKRTSTWLWITGLSPGPPPSSLFIWKRVLSSSEYLWSIMYHLLVSYLLGELYSHGV